MATVDFGHDILCKQNSESTNDSFLSDPNSIENILKLKNDDYSISHDTVKNNIAPFVDLFSRIKKMRHSLNFDILCDELQNTR